MAVAIGNTAEGDKAVATTFDVVIPTHSVGDHLVIHIANDREETITGTGTETWTQIGSEGDVNCSGHAYYLEVTGSVLSSPQEFTKSGNEQVAWWVAQITGADAAAFLDGVSFDTTATVALNHDAPSVTTASDNSLVLHSMARDRSGGWTTVPATQEASIDEGNGTGLAVSSGFQVTAGATGTKNFVIPGATNRGLLGFTYAIKAAGGGGGGGAMVPPSRISTALMKHILGR